MQRDPLPIAVSITFPAATVYVRHHPVTALDDDSGAVVLREPKVNADTLTEIDVYPYGDNPHRSIRVLWEWASGSHLIGIHLSKTADVLFVGAGTYAAAVRLDTGEVVDPHDVFLFWSFRESGRFVIELGELACFLRSATGEVLGEAAVDPPYEMVETPEGVRFESPVMGTHWLRFPPLTR